MVTMGTAVSRFTVTVAVDLFPARSVASTLIAFDPSKRGTPERLKSAPHICAATPFTATELAGSLNDPATVICGVLRKRPFWGCVMATVGAAVSRFTVTVAVDLFPARSFASTVIVFGPSTRGTPERLKSVPATGAARPLTVTELAGSLKKPVTVICGVLRSKPSTGDVMVIMAAAMSRLTVTVAVDLFPARFVASTLIVFDPSARGTPKRLKSVPAICAATPFTVIEVTGSLTEPTTATAGVFTYELCAGEVIWIAGARESTKTVTPA